MSDDAWLISNDRLDPPALGQFNSIATISNGYLGLKGNLQEDRDGYCPVTIINGVYDELDMFGLLRPSQRERRWLDPAYFDSAGPSPAVANLPDPLLVRVFVGNREISLGRGRVSAFRQVLDLRSGLYHYTLDCADGLCTTRIAMWRFAALVHPHRVYMRYCVTPLADAPLRIASGINAAVRSNITGERQFAVAAAGTGPEQTCRMHVRTRARRHDVYMTVVNRSAAPPAPTVVRGWSAHDAVYTVYEFFAQRGQPVTVDRFVCIESSENARHGVALQAEDDVEAMARQGFDAALEEQRAAWQALWERADVQIDGDELAQRFLRFCIHHLLAAAPRFTDCLSVPAKLLTGEYYQGNTFYDTDTYIVPFYMFTLPEQARACLNYRYHGLEPARAVARELGCAGAKFAWQGGPYGEECLGPWYRFVRANIHINADVAGSLMQYHWATGDEAFLRARGIDILVESARFYASRAVYEPGRDAYDLHDVAGPDEAHCESTNNFYTNYLALRTLRWAAESVARLGAVDAEAAAAAAHRLNLREDEVQGWLRVADRLTLLFEPQTKLYEQCEDFYKLPPPPADLLHGRHDWFVPLAPYQAMNQPDVVMGLALWRDDFPVEVRRANWEYYKGKSLNFSSMSFAVNALMAADLGELDEAHRQFMICAGMDLDESLTGRHDTYAGLHGTALGGAWMAAVLGFGGVHLSPSGLRLEPRLPPAWHGLRFKLMLRGEVVHVSIDPRSVSVRAKTRGGLDMPLRVAGRDLQLRSGGAHTVRYAGA